MQSVVNMSVTSLYSLTLCLRRIFFRATAVGGGGAVLCLRPLIGPTPLSRRTPRLLLRPAQSSRLWTRLSLRPTRVRMFSASRLRPGGSGTPVSRSGILGVVWRRARVRCVALSLPSSVLRVGGRLWVVVSVIVGQWQGNVVPVVLASYTHLS